MALAAAATAIVACNKVNTEIQQTTPSEEGFYYTFSLGEPATKAVLDSDENGRFVKWTDGDQLGSITTKSQGFSKITPATTETPAQFQIYSSKGLTEGNTINVWFPYRSTQTDATKVELQIPNEQTQRSKDREFDFKAMPMIAKQVTVTAEMATTSNPSPISTIDMEYLGSVINFKVFSTKDTYASEKVQKITFNGRNAANTSDANIGGVFTKNLVTIDPENEESMRITEFKTGYSSIVTSPLSASSIGTDKDSALDLYMVIAPGEFSGTVVVSTDAAEYTYTLSAKTFARGGYKAFGLDLGSAKAVRVVEDYTTTTFVFNTTAGIQALGLAAPAASAGTNVDRVVSDCIILTGDKGTNENTYPRVWNSSGTYNFRVNKNNTITFSINGGTIKGIAFDAGTKWNLSSDEGTLTGTNWKGSATSVTFTNSNTDRTDINTITVSYEGGVAPVDPVALVMSDITCTDAEQNENSLTFSWTAVENASGYQVSTDGGNNYGDVQSELTYTWTGLAAGREYTIYVKAVGDGTNNLTSEAKSQVGKTKASQGGSPTEQTIFLETFGATTSNTAFASYTGYSATSSMFSTSGDVKTHYSGDGKVGKSNLTNANLSSGYTDASGLSGCYHTGTAKTEATILTISDINIKDCENISVSFGALGGSTSHKINVYYKIDGGSETALISNGSITNASWNLLSANISGTGNSLTLIFKHTPTNAWTIRMDDIKVVGTK